MKQLDLFPETLRWPSDFDGAHSIAGICRAAPDGYNILVDPPKPPTKIYESPDKGKTVYARNFGETERVLIQSPTQNDVTLHDTMQGLQ